MNCDTNGCNNQATLTQTVELASPRSELPATARVNVCEEHRGAMHHTKGLRVIEELAR